MEVLTNHGQLCGITTETEGPLPPRSLKALADFVSNDLLSPCGKCFCSFNHIVFSLCERKQPLYECRYSRLFICLFREKDKNSEKIRIFLMVFAQFEIFLSVYGGFASGGMQEPKVVQPSSDPDIDNGLKVKKCSEINWEHLFRYYTHLLNLRHISRQPSTVKQFTCPNLMSCGNITVNGLL